MAYRFPVTLSLNTERMEKAPKYVMNMKQFLLPKLDRSSTVNCLDRNSNFRRTRTKLICVPSWKSGVIFSQVFFYFTLFTFPASCSGLMNGASQLIS